MPEIEELTKELKEFNKCFRIFLRFRIYADAPTGGENDFLYNVLHDKNKE